MSSVCGHVAFSYFFFLFRLNEIAKREHEELEKALQISLEAQKQQAAEAEKLRDEVKQSTVQPSAKPPVVESKQAAKTSPVESKPVPKPSLSSTKSPTQDTKRSEKPQTTGLPPLSGKPKKAADTPADAAAGWLQSAKEDAASSSAKPVQVEWRLLRQVAVKPVYQTVLLKRIFIEEKVLANPSTVLLFLLRIPLMTCLHDFSRAFGRPFLWLVDWIFSRLPSAAYICFELWLVDCISPPPPPVRRLRLFALSCDWWIGFSRFDYQDYEVSFLLLRKLLQPIYCCLSKMFLLWCFLVEARNNSWRDQKTLWVPKAATRQTPCIEKTGTREKLDEVYRTGVEGSADVRSYSSSSHRWRASWFFAVKKQPGGCEQVSHAQSSCGLFETGGHWQGVNCTK